MRAMEGQSVFDVAIIGCGTAEAALSLAIKNALSITAELSPGQHLDVVPMTNADTAAYFSNRGLVVATALGELAHHPAPPVVVSVIGSTVFVGDAVTAMDNQSLFDIAVERLGSADAALMLAVSNGMSVTDMLSPGQRLDLLETVNADVSAYFANKGIRITTDSDDIAHHAAPPVVVTQLGSSVFIGDAIVAVDNQSLFDLAIERLGSADAALMLAVKNGLSITDQPNAGQKLQPIDVANADIAGYFSARGIKPCTGATTNDGGGELAPEGIGYWAIGIDFVIS